MRESLKKNKKGIVIMLCSSLFACFGQLLWKLSATQGILILLVGFILYGIGALAMILAYRFGSVSVLQPVLSMNYALSLILGYFVLQEKISVIKIIGIVIITTGVLFIGGGDET